jgi:hypothetical protein
VIAHIAAHDPEDGVAMQNFTMRRFPQRLCAKGSQRWIQHFVNLAYEDRFAAVFALAGVTLRVSHVPDFTPHEHTILGFIVPDVVSTVTALAGLGVAFNRYPAFTQDERGILTLPGGKQVAWFADPDGNVLSVTDVS